MFFLAMQFSILVKMDVAETIKYDITHVVSSLKGVPNFNWN